VNSINDLTQPEILALAISSEEEDGRIYADFAEGLREHHPDTANVFSDMAAEENDHRRMLIDLIRVEVRQPHPAHQASRCARFRSA